MPSEGDAAAGMKRKEPGDPRQGEQANKVAKPSTSLSALRDSLAARVPKAPVAKAAVAKAPVAKAPTIKAYVAKAPLSKAPLTKSPAAQAPLAKAAVSKAPSQAPASSSPISKAPVSKAPVAKAAKAPVASPTLSKAPVSKAPVSKAPLPVGALVAKAPMSKAPVAKAPLAMAPVKQSPSPSTAALSGAIPKGAVAKAPAPSKAPSKAPAVAKVLAGPRPPAGPPASPPASPPADEKAEIRGDSWREFSDVDPLYALLGEVQEKTIFNEQGTFNEELCYDYIRRLFVPGVTSKTKDWVEIWAAMSIPIDKQGLVIQAILEVGLDSELAETMSDILVDLVKGHRCKIKAIEETVSTLFECGGDQHSCLQRFLLMLFPKSPTSEWGWSRVGWSWQQWWSTTEKLLGTLEAGSAFETLVQLLTAIETESGTYLPHQQIWDESRLAKVRAALCKFGGLEEGMLADSVALCLE